ncbi:unnamed protein product, partial [Mesorhabditis belari]|uniref:Phosphoserine phosphatase n=1 Tax=Mesorhabditis belari TaxID=2138241 RepID=A0AAF3FP72_9BILA
MMVEHHRRIDSDQKMEPKKVELEDETGEERAKRVWKMADCVCFDVDSTVCRDEAIDELANFLGVVYLVSGGFRSLIEPVADCLKISRTKIYANVLLFNEDGSYSGFDENELTSDSGSKEIGKPGVCALLKKKYGYENLVMIGDGATDYEAFPPADAFIGFGGNQIRENVRTNAPWYVYDFEVLRRELED